MSENRTAENLQIDKQLDLRGVVCPMNFVQTKLQLEGMESGQILEVILDAGEAMRNVPQSVKDDGHKILKVEKLTDAFKLTIRKV
jgi:tRNA 2-thiouridine synthesizing protein A